MMQVNLLVEHKSWDKTQEYPIVQHIPNYSEAAQQDINYIYEFGLLNVVHDNSMRKNTVYLYDIEGKQRGMGIYQQN